MTDIHRHHLLLAPLEATHCKAPAIARAKALVEEWICRARSRREIAKLDDRAISDLGLSPSQLQFEARKPFWRA